MPTTSGEAPMNPESSEATAKQLALARAQGDAYQAALQHMAQDVADTGGVQQVGEYLVGYAVEEAEGMYSPEGDDLVWRNPDDTNAHIEIVVCDAADGRFIPCLDVEVTVITPQGDEIGPHIQELLWHPMMYHYGRNWMLPEDGEYTLRVHVDPPSFMRHDEINGRRFTAPVDIDFTSVAIERGSEPVEPPTP